MEKLEDYRAKRKFDKTPEPGISRISTAKKPAAPRFVIHEHHATRLHWDFRLEHEGVLVSWALPKGIPMDKETKRLAVHVEDHPLEYIDFAGDIPAGEYGAGQVIVWDTGTYESLKFRDNEVVIVLKGERVEGKYVLFHTQGKNWIIHRMDPPPPAFEPMPGGVVPMLAKLATKPPVDNNAYAFEIKWDGIRALLYSDYGHVKIVSRNQNDITDQYPELRKLGESLGGRPVVLDGEIIAPLDDGRPSFERLQRRMGVASAASARRLMNEVPVNYIIFDLLYLDGRSVMKLNYRERRRLLEELGLKGFAWQTPAYHTGDGAAFLEAAKGKRLEGTIAKRLDSLYEPGKRTGAWLKIKNSKRQELVIGGWTPGEGGRAGRIGSLLVGYYESARISARKSIPAKFVFAGSVGTGYTEKTLIQLMNLLKPLGQEENPFAKGKPPAGAFFVKPELVAEIEFNEWTKAGILRQPSFKGLRYDKDALDVVREI